jgi:hypothetical protein
MKKIFAFIVIVAACVFTNACTNNYAETPISYPPLNISKIKLRNKPYSIEIADLNVDKIKDLIIANGEDSSVTILLGTGNGHFREANGSPFPAGYMPNDIANCYSRF